MASNAGMNAYRELAKVFSAFSHPVRLRILHALAHGEHCVCHLTTLLKKRQPYISQQLMILREAGLVADRKDGWMVYYRLRSPRILELMATMTEILQTEGRAVVLPAIPSGPVEGCPCPQCSGVRPQSP